MIDKQANKVFSYLVIKVGHGDTTLERRFRVYVTRSKAALINKSFTCTGCQLRTYGAIAGTHRAPRNLMLHRNRLSLENYSGCTAYIIIPCFPRVCFEHEIMDLYLF